ncbi:hypothetical protein AX16_001874 [Volvariella volvacea WC 439]|nr:hypothetical protein AX16_001874 [Volvariella volvacea WC 439]
MAVVKAPSVHVRDDSLFAPELDRALFDHAWARVRDYTSVVPTGPGVGLHEAKVWHRRAYGGLGELNQMTPSEVGHAAAYEAHRNWRRSHRYDPLETERQREGLIGLAVAEATRLLQYLPHHAANPTARTLASEAAAFTASTIFYQNRDEIDDHRFYRSSRSRRNSWSSYEDTDGYDSYSDDYRDRRHRSRSRARSRHPSRSRSRHRSYHSGTQPPAIVQVSYPGHPPSTIPVPGAASSAYSSQGVGPYGSYNAYPPYGSAPGALPYHGSVGGPGYEYRHHGASVPMVVPAGAPVAYPQSAYPPGPGMTTVVGPGQPQPQMIVIPGSHRKHKHRHHRHGRSRSSSAEPPYITYATSRY